MHQQTSEYSIIFYETKITFYAILSYKLNKSNNHKSWLNQSLSTKILLNIKWGQKY